MINLYDYQKEAVNKLKSGSILCGGVGSGKSITSLAYYIKEEYPKDMYIITTAKKRDSLEWDKECERLSLDSPKIDSWNNIKKYQETKDCFFIFDEQRVVGSGTWVKAFIKIAKRNHWILLTATPGDTWSDYIPVFIANGFYKNRTEFIFHHVIYKPYSKYRQIDRYVGQKKLEKLKKQLLVEMDYTKHTKSIIKEVLVTYDKQKIKEVMKTRFNPYEKKPFQNANELWNVIRKIVNADESRLDALIPILRRHPKAIIFYNFNYELDMLRSLSSLLGIVSSEWNGSKHEPVPKGDEWIYLVQYSAGAEGWNCIETDTVIFFSQNYSYKIMRQAAGRIDRSNTPYEVLYYYILKSSASIDIAIAKALKEKKNFNLDKYIKMNS